MSEVEPASQLILRVEESEIGKGDDDHSMDPFSLWSHIAVVVLKLIIICCSDRYYFPLFFKYFAVAKLAMSASWAHGHDDARSSLSKGLQRGFFLVKSKQLVLQECKAY